MYYKEIKVNKKKDSKNTKVSVGKIFQKCKHFASSMI